MKNKILLLGSVFLLASCGANNVNRNILKEVEYSSTGVVLLTSEFSYQNDNLLSIKQTSDAETSLYSCTYNSKGLLLNTKSQVLEDGVYVDGYLSTNTYDNHDVLIASENFTYSKADKRYVLTDTYTFEYDERGNITKESCVSYDKTLAVVLQSEITYKYNASNFVTETDEKFFDFDAGEMAYFSGERNTYDSENNLLKQVILDENKDVLMTSNYHYEGGLLKNISTTKVYDGVEMPFKEVTFEYDSNKNLITEKSVYSVNGFGDEVIRQEYDNHNRVVKKSYFDLDGDQEVLDSYYTYSY